MNIFGGQGPGLLGGMQDPRVMGLLGLSQGLLQAGSPSRMPISTGGALAQGLQGGLQGVMQADQLQKSDLKHKTLVEQQKRITDFASTLSEADRQRFLIDPGAYLKSTSPYTLPPGGVRMGPDNKPLFTAPTKPNPSPLGQLLQEKQALPPDSPYADVYRQALEKSTTHPPATQVTVSSEKKYGEHFAKNIADSDVSLRDTASKATDLADRANRVKQTLASGKVITGAGADYRLSFGKALGLAGMSDADTIANTETLVTTLAQNTLDAIKASGLGSGSGFSNADRDFLEKAVGGKITLEAKTIDRLADLSHRAASKSAQRWNDRVRQIPKSALEGTGIDTSPINVAPLFGGTAAPINPNIQRLLDKYAPQ